MMCHHMWLWFIEALIKLTKSSAPAAVVDVNVSDISEPVREKWSRKIDFLLACIGELHLNLCQFFHFLDFEDESYINSLPTSHYLYCSYTTGQGFKNAWWH